MSLDSRVSVCVCVRASMCECVYVRERVFLQQVAGPICDMKLEHSQALAVHWHTRPVFSLPLVKRKGAILIFLCVHFQRVAQKQKNVAFQGFGV